MKALTPVLLTFLLLSTPNAVSAQSEAVVQEMQEWILWNNCAPISLDVRITEKAKRAGISEPNLVAAIETRFRSARIYGDKGLGLAFFSIFLDVSNVTYHTEGSLQLHTYRQLKSEEWKRGPVTTWLSSSFGTYKDTDFILKTTAGIADQFITDYLRVNYNAC